MAVAGGPNLSENGLVFYYDTDNGKSYKGEPATNSQDPDYAAFTQAGFDAWGCYDGSNSHLWDVNQSKTFLNILGPDGYPTNVMLYHNFTGGFHGPTHWGGVPAALLTAGSKITVQGWVKAADAASVGKSVAPHLYYNKIGGGSYSSSTSYALTEEWQLVSHSYTVPEGSTGTGTMYFFTQNPSEVKMYLTKTAIVGGKLHAVQWLPGATTRSATESLYDLAGDAPLSTAYASFNSDADISFDGTGTNNNIYIVGGVPTNLKFYGDHTIEAVFNPDSALHVDSTSAIVRAGMGTDILYSLFFSNYAKGASYQYYNGSFQSAASTNNVITSDQFNHVVAIKQGLRVDFYVNGQAAGGGNITQSTQNPSQMGIGATRSGPSTGTAAQDFAGEIPMVKFYNRALTAEEVQNNFNGIRSRFGI